MHPETQIHVREGDLVAAGAPLVTLDGEVARSERSELLGRLRELLSELAIPVIYVTHSQEELRFWDCPAIELRLRPGPPGSEPVIETVSAP